MKEDFVAVSFRQAPTASSRKPPGYKEIEELSFKASDDEAWATFTRNILKLDGWKVVAVQEVVKQGRWRSAGNPIGYVKTASIQQANRMGLREDTFKAPADRSRQCPCGYTTQAKALKSGHTCVAGEIGSISDIKTWDAVWSSRNGDISGRQSLVSHDTTMDLLLFVHDHCNGGDDFGDPFYIEEDGKTYCGSEILWRVKQEFIRLAPSNSLNYDGVAKIDWLKVAAAARLNLVEAEVLNFRYGFGITRQQLFDLAGADKNLRLRYQAAWRSIDRSQEQIREILGVRKRESSLPPGLQVAPPVRRTEIPMPERLRADDDEILQDLDRRFAVRGIKKELQWGQNLRSGRRF